MRAEEWKERRVFNKVYDDNKQTGQTTMTNETLFIDIFLLLWGRERTMVVARGTLIGSNGKQFFFNRWRVDTTTCGVDIFKWDGFGFYTEMIRIFVDRWRQH